ncbi:MAG TPA: GTP 3',8-cyclase MoaA [Verrucomicrobiae bacterium]|nr:GTP 3',8-cyclase MoaA [Verrucomicrobiae bacterium]
MIGLSDGFGRVMRDLRVSLTDKCNFRCVYCLPESEEAANFYRTRFDSIKNPNPPKPFALPQFKPRTALLSFEEIERLIRIAAPLGIEKIRLTGGEPLLRKDIEHLVDRISRIRGIEDIAITTNGFLFAQKAEALKAAGLNRVSFSMDSLDRENFRKITGRDGLIEVLAGIRLAKRLGMNPVKVNAVMIRGLNDHELESLCQFALEEEISFRFIEFMPLDSSRAWLKDLVVPAREILERLTRSFQLTPVQSSNRSETAKRWRINGSNAELGMIAPVSEPFCGHCNRLRLTADGKIRTCLFSLHEHDLKALLRNGAADDRIAQELGNIVLQKEARHHIGEPEFVQPERTMSCIGG